MPDGPSTATRYRPDPAEIGELVRRATRHPLGIEFLTGGALDAVAAVFRVHAFAVEAARESLARGAGAVELHAAPPRSMPAAAPHGLVPPSPAPPPASALSPASISCWSASK
jgi:hypothetical protein